MILSKSQLTYLRDRIKREATNEDFCYLTSWNTISVVSWERGNHHKHLDDYVVERRQDKVNRINSLLDLLNPNLVVGQMSLGRGLSIYNESREARK